MTDQHLRSTRSAQGVGTPAARRSGTTGHTSAGSGDPFSRDGVSDEEYLGFVAAGAVDYLTWEPTSPNSVRVHGRQASSATARTSRWLSSAMYSRSAHGRPMSTKAWPWRSMASGLVASNRDPAAPRECERATRSGRAAAANAP